MKKLLILPILVLLIISCWTPELEQNTENNNKIENSTEENVEQIELTNDEEKMINDILEIN